MKRSIVKDREADGVYGLLGKGISHSFSPKLHSYLGGYSYRLFDLEELGAKKFILSKAYSGLNVTMPYKKLAYSYCDVLSDTAKSTGSVNTIVNKGGLLYGYNTDYDGFKRLIVNNKIDVNKKKAVILGSGGASNTIRAVLEEMNAKTIITVSRFGANNYRNIENNYDADIVINATPVGMYPELNREIIDISKFKKCENVVDIIYNPLSTRLLSKSKLSGKKVCNGISMLVFQGIESSRLFIGDGNYIDSKKIIKTLINKKRNIVLIGMPGVGKSSLGLKVAKKLGMKFFDTDQMIYNLFKIKCEDIIKSKGESFFRKLESKVVEEVSKESNAVISTGGGVVLNEENMLSLMSNGVIFFVKRDFDLINKNCGAILRAGGVDNLYNQRRYEYKKYSDFEVYNNFSIDKTVKEVIYKSQI